MERLTEVVYKKGYCKRKPACDGSCEDCNHFETMVDRLAYYEELEEQGLLLRLPCKVGDTYFRILYGDIYENEFNNTATIVSMMEDGAFGKTVFLTKEEAEQKLESMQKGENNGKES